jgi:hypothetical protein
MSNPNAGNTTVPTAKNTNLTPNVQMGENATGVTAPATLLANGTSTRSVTVVFRPVQKHQLQTALKKYEAGDLSLGTPNQWDVHGPHRHE